MDFTGVIGVKKHGPRRYFNLKTGREELYHWYQDHLYTFLNDNRTAIAHSAGSRGMVVDDVNSTGLTLEDKEKVEKRIERFIQKTNYYLKVKSLSR